MSGAVMENILMGTRVFSKLEKALGITARMFQR